MASYRCHLLLFGILLERKKFILFFTACSKGCHFNVAFPADYSTALDL